MFEEVVGFGQRGNRDASGLTGSQLARDIDVLAGLDVRSQGHAQRLKPGSHAFDISGHARRVEQQAGGDGIRFCHCRSLPMGFGDSLGPKLRREASA
jgi:hypothetical protein